MRDTQDEDASPCNVCVPVRTVGAMGIDWSSTQVCGEDGSEGRVKGAWHDGKWHLHYVCDGAITRSYTTTRDGHEITVDVITHHHWDDNKWKPREIPR